MKKLAILIVLTCLTLSIAGYFYKRARADKTHDVLQPFTADFIQYGINFNEPSQSGIGGHVTRATSSDGKFVEIKYPAEGSTLTGVEIRKITDNTNDWTITVNPAKKIKTTLWRNRPKALSSPKASRYDPTCRAHLRYLPGGWTLVNGAEVIRGISVAHWKGIGEGEILEEYLAPTCHCMPLREINWTRDATGQIVDKFDTMLASIALGEPDARLFSVARDTNEVPPSTFNAETFKLDPSDFKSGDKEWGDAWQKQMTALQVKTK